MLRVDVGMPQSRFQTCRINSFRNKTEILKTKKVEKSIREARKNKESKENGHEAKELRWRGRTPLTARPQIARPRHPLLNKEVYVDGAPARPRWCVRVTPLLNEEVNEDRALARPRWRVRAIASGVHKMKAKMGISRFQAKA
ncbi:hypothetical protein PIB30_030262 [Stylosanthes scabra]|uniref:Uncharacterized protein n=1 Tax=Stylosanthes scabra TaxID=79078 RepID=A0ABU6YBP7_9FABA|nr:hypothetical protein [Stylosanthes scabra]